MFFNQPIEVTRATGGGYVGGVWQPGTATTLTLQSSVQPVSESDMALLPEGRRQQESYALYTADPLYMANDNAGTNADVVSVSGKNFEVVHCEAWQNKLIPHHKTLIVLEAEQP